MKEQRGQRNKVGKKKLLHLWLDEEGKEAVGEEQDVIRVKRREPETSFIPWKSLYLHKKL